MIVALLANAYRFWGEWNEFYSVIAVQLLFGQGFFSYISGKEINVAPGGGSWGAPFFEGAYRLERFLSVYPYVLFFRILMAQ